MRRARTLSVLLICLAALLPCTASAARNCTSHEVATWTADTATDARLCLGVLQNVTAASCSATNALCEDVARWLRKPLDQGVVDSSRLLAAIRDGVDAVAREFPYARPLHRELDRWMKDLTAASAADLRSGTGGPRAEPVRHWEFVGASFKILENEPNEVDLRVALDKECAAPEQCTKALRAAGATVIYATLAQTVAGHLLPNARAEGAAYIEMLDKRWDKYFDTERFQYPWELAINDWRFRKQGRAGFVSPPEDQWIVLHPSAGLRYNPKGEQTFEALLVLEVVGIHRWGWKGADREDKWGGSLVVAWAGQSGGSGETKPGVGFIVYAPKSYAIGLLRHTVAGQDTTSLMVNVDVAKLFENKAEVRQRLQGLVE